MNKERLLQLLQRFQDEALNLVRVIQDKGVKYFSRPLGIAAAVLIGVYWLAYQPSISQLRRVESQLVAAQATAKYTDRYKELDNRLQAFYSTLPKTKDRGSWLLETVRDAMKKDEKIMLKTINPAEEREIGGYVLASLMVTAHSSYKGMASWISRLERSKSLLHISSLVLTKDTSDIGMNTVQLTVTTVAPKDGGGQ
ncbi:MAG: type 4a pilus biogenesis protein PilO [Elusimicrobia bacterium]|nr:type 4a pilus biogenesis protein PilO [Elusimicrobiota bacterium]